MKNYIIYLSCLLLFTTCSKKNITTDLVEVECKTLELTNARYTTEDRCTTFLRQSQNFTSLLRVNHNNKINCLDFITLNAKFYTRSGAVMKGRYKQYYQINDAEVSYTASEFQIKFSWLIEGDAYNFDYAEIEIFSQNDLNSQSNKLYFTIPVGCPDYKVSPINNIPVDILTEEKVTSSKVQLDFSDYGAEDGDIVDVYLNGVKIINDLFLTKATKTFFIDVKTGANQLSVIALNEGKVSPNTCKIVVNQSRILNFSPGLSRGQGVFITF